ncbi:hypothetical protein [Streptomyces rubiginosohelvolus]|uniref:hypothetical protein n=1 Tax=Streptomyces rubiginosohelvolus TaxID=67362 RepID=UPI0033E174BF
MPDAEQPRVAVYARTDSGHIIHLPEATVETTGPDTLRITEQDSAETAPADRAATLGEWSALLTQAAGRVKASWFTDEATAVAAKAKLLTLAADPATMPRCPRCDEDLTDYADDDRVYRKGDTRPYCSGECVVFARTRHLPIPRWAVEAQPPTSSEADTPFGAPDCTCIPWTRQGGTKRLLGPADTVDQISGWERARDCAHHAGISTLPHWLYRRFASGPTVPAWDLLTADDRSYWEHQARAVERAVKRGGFNGMDPWLLLGIDQPADTHEPAAPAGPAATS